MSLAGLADKLDTDEETLRAETWPIGQFVRVASVLDLPDFNALVGLVPRDTWVPIESSDVLQGLLDVTDEVVFAVSDKLPSEHRPVIEEAASDLRAARWVAAQNRAGVIGGLNPSVHSWDAEEFLAQLDGVDCHLQAGVKPMFVHDSKLEVPAVGKRLVIAILPKLS
jgi:hypothetical protein